jgi:hypothetical protein
MAYAHISIDTSKRHGGRLRAALDQLEAALSLLNEEVAAMPFMLNGADYTHLEEQFGFEAGKGQEAKPELESALLRLNSDTWKVPDGEVVSAGGNSTVTTNTHAALVRMFNKFA